MESLLSSPWWEQLAFYYCLFAGTCTMLLGATITIADFKLNSKSKTL